MSPGLCLTDEEKRRVSKFPSHLVLESVCTWMLHFEVQSHDMRVVSSLVALVKRVEGVLQEQSSNPETSDAFGSIFPSDKAPIVKAFETKMSDHRGVGRSCPPQHVLAYSSQW